MKKFISAILLTLTVAACASSIMEGYIGKDVREVMLDRGPPMNAFDMPDGRRAFQWQINSSYTTPAYATTTGTVNNYGYNSWFTGNTIVTGGQTYSSSCTYTLFANRNPSADAWIVVGFQEPDFMCE